MTRDAEENLIYVLQHIAKNLEKQNELLAESIDLCKRLLGVNIINVKIAAMNSFKIGALDTESYEEIIKLLNSI